MRRRDSERCCTCIYNLSCRSSPTIHSTPDALHRTLEDTTVIVGLYILYVQLWYFHLFSENKYTFINRLKFDGCSNTVVLWYDPVWCVVGPCHSALFLCVSTPYYAFWAAQPTPLSYCMPHCWFSQQRQWQVWCSCFQCPVRDCWHHCQVSSMTPVMDYSRYHLLPPQEFNLVTYSLQNWCKLCGVMLWPWCWTRPSLVTGQS